MKKYKKLVEKRNKLDTVLSCFELMKQINTRKEKIETFEQELKKDNAESQFVSHARKELMIAGFFDKESDYDGMIGKSVMRLIEKFDNEDHSGASASICASLFTKLSSYGILTPLTEENVDFRNIEKDDDGNIQSVQSRRVGSVFKESDGIMTYMDAICWVDQDNGHGFSGTVEGVSSTQAFKFPFVPKTFRIRVKYINHKDDDSETVMIDKSDLDAVFKYYEMIKT